MHFHSRRNSASTRLIPSRSSPHFLLSQAGAGLSKVAHHSLTFALTHPTRVRTASQHITTPSTGLRHAYETGCIALSAPVASTFEHKASLTVDDWHKLIDFETCFVREHFCEYCKNCEVHGVHYPLLPRSATTALLPLPETTKTAKLYHPLSRNPLKAISHNIVSLTHRVKKFRDWSPTYSIAEDKVVNPHSVSEPRCTCCTQSLRRRIDPLLQDSEQQADQPESFIHSPMELDNLNVTVSHERSTISHRSRHQKQIQPVSEDSAISDTNSSDGSIFAEWVNRAKLNNTSFRARQFVIEGEEEAQRFMAITTAPGFDINQIKSLHIVLNANDFNSKIDDYLAMGKFPLL
jgi:hypothetical protein